MRRKFYGLILPGFILSFLAGVVVGFVIFFFKLAIDYILKLNNLIYHFLNNYIYFIPVTIIILLMHLLNVGCLKLNVLLFVYIRHFGRPSSFHSLLLKYYIHSKVIQSIL